MISAKLLVLFYVDPEDGGIKRHVDAAIKAEKYGMEGILVWL